jgi:hypothetical protein
MRQGTMSDDMANPFTATIFLIVGQAFLPVCSIRDRQECLSYSTLLPRQWSLVRRTSQ